MISSKSNCRNKVTKVKFECLFSLDKFHETNIVIALNILSKETRISHILVIIRGWQKKRSSITNGVLRGECKF